MYRHFLLLFACLLALSGASTIVRAEDHDEETEGNAPKERFDWFYLQRSYPNGIPAGARLKALRQLRAMTAAKQRDNVNRTAATVWQQVGPNNVGGRITAVAYDASAPAVYIGAAEGGVWKGVPGGATGWTWTPCTDKADALAMGALAVDPNNGSIVWAGTGEWAQGWGGFFGTGSPQYSGAGILKSTDAGATWTNMGLYNVAAAFSRVIVNPDNSQIVWAATNRGLWRTGDGGLTWTALVKDSACSDMVLDPNDHKRLYVAIAGNGVFGVFDEDTTSLRRLSAGFAAADTTMGRISISASAQGSTTILYAVAATAGGGYKGMWKFNGFSWSSLTGPSSLFGSNNQGWYDITIGSNPNDASKVMVGGVGVYYSVNGGTSWNYGNVHPDQHAICFDQSGTGTVLVGNDGGIYLSDNNGASLTDISEGLAITQFYGIDVDPGAAGNAFGGSQDNGSWMGTGVSWSGIGSGDGGMTRSDPKNSSVYVEALAGGAAGGGPGTVAKIRTDGSGASVVFENATQPGERHPWVRAIAVDRSNSNVYVSTQRLYRSGSGGASFSAISGDLTRGGSTAASTISTIGITPGNPDVIWTGSNDGLAFVTKNGGSTWTNISGGLPGRAVTRIVPTGINTAYATISGYGPGHVLKTTNGGTTWNDLTSNLPDVPVNAFAIDPDNAKHLFIGTDIGVLYSVDDGASWVPYMEGLPNVVVNELVVQEGTKQLYAGTYGRSTWKAPMTAQVVALGSPVYGPVWYTNQTYPIVWYGLQNAKISLSTDNGTTWSEIDNGQNGPTYNWDIPSSINTTVARIKVDNGATTLVSDPFTIRPPQTGDVLATVSRPFVPYSLAFDGYNLWCTSFYEKKIYKLDPDYLTVRDTIKSPNSLDSCTGIAWSPDTKQLYVHRLNGSPGTNGRPQHKIFLIDTLGNVIKTAASPVTYPTGLAYDGTSLYAVDRGASKIYVIDPGSLTAAGGYTDPVYAYYGPRGLSYIGDNKFLHIVSVFNTSGTLKDAYMYRMELGAGGFVATDTAILLNTGGGQINARGIERDPRPGHANTYWVSDFGSGTSGSIYRIVGFDLQALSVTAPQTAAVWNTGEQHAITWSSKLIDSVSIDYTTDNGATWNPVAPMMASTGSYQWTVPDIATSNKCKVRITANSGARSTSGTFSIKNSTAVAEKSTTPDGFELYQNYPNPFNPTTEITYVLPRSEHVKLQVYDDDGKLVMTLVDGNTASGMHRVTVDATTMPSGAYTYVLRAGTTELRRSMLLTK